MLIVTKGLVGDSRCGIRRACTSAMARVATLSAPGRVGAAEDDREFFAAVARDQIGRAVDRAFQDRRDLLQAFVSGVVPVGVVEELEVIDVDEDERHLIFRADRAPPLGCEKLLEAAAVADAGEPVGVREVLQFLVRQPQRLGLVGDDLAKLALARLELRDPGAPRAKQRRQRPAMPLRR